MRIFLLAVVLVIPYGTIAATLTDGPQAIATLNVMSDPILPETSAPFSNRSAFAGSRLLLNRRAQRLARLAATPEDALIALVAASSQSDRSVPTTTLVVLTAGAQGNRSLILICLYERGGRSLEVAALPEGLAGITGSASAQLEGLPRDEFYPAGEPLR